MSKLIVILIGIVICVIGSALFMGGFAVLIRFVFAVIKKIPMEDAKVTKYDRLTNIDDKAFEFGNENEQPKNRWFKGIYVHKGGYFEATYKDYKKFGGGFKLILLSIIFFCLGCSLINISRITVGALIFVGVLVGFASVGIIAMANEGKKVKAKEDEIEYNNTLPNFKGYVIFVLSIVIYVAVVSGIKMIIGL